jgi:hypothetical protein
MNAVKTEEPFCLRKENIWAMPILHYNMEMAAHVRQIFAALQPDCVAVELAETMQLQLLHGASRLPDISVIIAQNNDASPTYYMCEPCDAAFEGLRSALESGAAAWCIDLDIESYPSLYEGMPDPYAIQRIGLKNYYETYRKLVLAKDSLVLEEDRRRELHMARRLKELSLRYEKTLFIGGMAHVERILKLIDSPSFPHIEPVKRDIIQLVTVKDASCREVLAECGWISRQYELMRCESHALTPFPDRQKLIYDLLKAASAKYMERTGNGFPWYNMRNMMKFMRNYALLCGRLMPDLYQILSAAKGCVDHNYAYEVWELATDYPFLRNVDNLPEIPLTVQDLWKNAKHIRFHLKEKNAKSSFRLRPRKDSSKQQFKPPGPFSICSYPPEDVAIERFGEFLKKKGSQILLEESARTIPFSTSVEDGIDVKESIRHWHEKKLYVKTKGKPPGGVGSIVIIFDEDNAEDSPEKEENYPWCATWLGEHSQESDMAFYATGLRDNVVGPGISRCEYGGFMMSYPPRRLYDVWNDADYQSCKSKAEVLLMAAIDYAVNPLITYVAAKPPRSWMKSYARRFAKKVVYLPIGQLSPVILNKLRAFHVLDGHDRRDTAGEYIF